MRLSMVECFVFCKMVRVEASRYEMGVSIHLMNEIIVHDIREVSGDFTFLLPSPQFLQTEIVIPIPEIVHLLKLKS